MKEVRPLTKDLKIVNGLVVPDNKKKKKKVKHDGIQGN